MSAVPSSDNFPHSASTSSFVVQAIRKETDGLNLKSGPALMAMNGCPESSNETISTDPEGVLSRRVVFVIFEFLNKEV